MSLQILIATRNPGKEREIRTLMAHTDYGIVFPSDLGLLQDVAEEGLETAATFEGNATHKAEYFQRKLRLATVAEDSGIEVRLLGGLPGVRSRRFALASVNQDEANNAELLRRLSGAPAERRGAQYRCVIVFLANAGATPRVFEGVCQGRILTEPRGSAGFGYDPIFHSEELGKSFGEATREEKDRVSHRGKAFRAFLEWLTANPL
jgi:XTP/dITP diphosphohydrolase